MSKIRVSVGDKIYRSGAIKIDKPKTKWMEMADDYEGVNPAQLAILQKISNGRFEIMIDNDGSLSIVLK